MIPIEKNIIVSDVNGRRIGATYPKRAEGLVKNGRAEMISDHEIRLKITQSLAVSIDTEENNMSKVINFNARDFEFDASCNTNVGFRGFVTTALGNEEVWEIGNWNWDWTQICANLSGLEKNMDYVFRFAMTLGHNDDNREESLVHIHYTDSDNAWENRFTYCIKMSRFRPILSKRDPEEDTMIRVFELPFNTGEHTDFRIVIVSQHAVARFFTARENATYAELEDLSYPQWREQRTLFLEKQQEERNMRANRFSMLPSEFKLPPEFQKMPEIPEMPEIPAHPEIPSLQKMINDIIRESISDIEDTIEDRIEEAIQDSINDLFPEGGPDPSKPVTKVLSPDKKKLLSCYGGLKVEDTSRWNGKVKVGFSLSVQVKPNTWEILYIYDTEKEAADALVAVNRAIQEGMTLIEL